MARTIRLGTCAPPAPATPAAALACLEQLARRAAARAVDLLLLPEAFLGGGAPPVRGGLGGLLGTSRAAAREAFLQCVQRAVDLGDDDDGDGDGVGDGTRAALERVARDTGVFLVVGAVERAAGRRLYSAVVYVCPARGVLGTRRKLQLTPLESLVWSAAGPASLRAVSADLRGRRVRLAAAVGAENYRPLVRHALYAQDVHLYLAPTAAAAAADDDGSDTWLALLRTIGVEGRCFVLAASTAPTAAAERPATRPTSAAPTHDAAHAPVTTTIVESVSASGQPRRRKKSFVLDEHGNEIVLACEAVDGPAPPPPSSSSPPDDAPEQPPPPLPPFPRRPRDPAWARHKHQRRRSSVFDEDDNEIVLCRPGDTAAAAPDAVGTQTAPTPPTAAFAAAAVVSPFGRVLAGPLRDDTDAAGDPPILTADVDLDDCVRGRLDLDGAGPFRHDAFKLCVEGLDLVPLP